MTGEVGVCVRTPGVHGWVCACVRVCVKGEELNHPGVR